MTRDEIQRRVQEIFTTGCWGRIRLPALCKSLNVPYEILIAALSGGARYRLVHKAGVIWIVDTATKRIVRNDKLDDTLERPETRMGKVA